MNKEEIIKEINMEAAGVKEDTDEKDGKKAHSPEHYYGDIIRKLFFLGSIAILVTFPFFYDVLPYSGLSILGGATLFILLAGLTSPKQRLVLFFDAIVSFVAIVFFEYYSVQFYLWNNGAFEKWFLFLVSYFLSINFLFAFYFSVKTLRRIFSKSKI